MSRAVFPILWSGHPGPHEPKSVPWSFVAPHEAQARQNHDQTLERLAERGGLDPKELHSVVHGLSWHRNGITFADAVTWLRTVTS